MKQILTDLEMNRQVDEGWKMNQGFTSKQQIKQNQSNHQQVPAKTNGIHNLIGDYQRPPEVPENTGNVQNGNNMGQQPVEAYPILNQKWEDPPHMQAPMVPTSVQQNSPEGEDPMSGRSNEFDYGDESTSQNKLYGCKSGAAGQHGE